MRKLIVAAIAGLITLVPVSMPHAADGTTHQEAGSAVQGNQGGTQAKKHRRELRKHMKSRHVRQHAQRRH